MELILNLIICLICTFSILAIVAQNPIYAILSLIVVFVLTALFLLNLKIEFLALILIIIYAGAISTLFIFVILLLNISEFSYRYFNLLTISPLANLLGIKILVLFYTMQKIVKIKELIPSTDIFVVKLNMLQELSTFLYIDYGFLLIVIGFVLLTAMMGTLVLTKRNLGKI